jgi:imidazole glycerol phosphate synthase subunit HisF
LAASIFHYGQHSVQEAKEYMARQGVPVRMWWEIKWNLFIKIY